MSKNSFKGQVKDAAEKASLEYLLHQKQNMSKISHIKYTKLHMQEYLKASTFTNKEAETLCNARGRMIDVKANYKGSHTDLSCPPQCDKNNLDTQSHLLSCDNLHGQDIQIVNTNQSYEDIFSDNVDKQLITTRVLINKLELRKKILSTRSSTLRCPR